MQQSDFDQFSQLLTATAEMYSKPMTEVSLMLWWTTLQAYDIAAVREGLMRHMQNPDSGQFMPKPADVIKFIGGTTQDGALVAWAKVDRAVRSIGTYQTVVFDDPIIHAVIADMGGWISMGSRNEDEWPFVAKEFENRYRGYRMRGGAEQYQKTLIGIADSSNAISGQPMQPPVLIGNEIKARQVLERGTDRPAIGWRQIDVAERLGLAAPVERGEAA